MIQIHDEELYWLAGLLEGEACFYPQTEKYPVGLSIESTDEDIIERVCQLFNTKYCQPSKRQNHHKQSYKTALRGKDAIHVMKEILPIMGKRRSQKITECINSYQPKLIGILTPEEILEIKRLHSIGMKVKDISKLFPVTHWRIYQLVR
jgi:hypothetical protein